jgi:hypothetical protein
MSAPQPRQQLSQAIAEVRPLLTDGSRSTKERIRLVWAVAKNARQFAASDVLHGAFMALAVETKLIDARGYWPGGDVAGHVRCRGAEDVAHVIAWALRGLNPFETGPLT